MSAHHSSATLAPSAATSRFSTVVVGVGDEDGARDAAALALDLAAPGCTLVLTALAVDPLASPLTPPGADDARAARAAGNAERLRTSISERERPCGIERDVRSVASVGAGLRDSAREHEADLIVVGSSRRGALQRVLGVNDVRAAVDRAPCAVAVAPRGYADGPRSLARIGVGWDRSPAADTAVELGRRLADTPGTTLRVLQVVPEVPWAVDPLNVARSDASRIAVARAHLAATGLPDLDVDVHEGNATTELGGLAEEVDLLIVGVPLRDGHLSAGHTVHGLIHHLGCALLIAPGAA